MHGSLRFFLATLVVLSHIGIRAGDLNVGMPAVVVFYMLAGYVVTHLCQKHFPPGKLLAFYAERFLRIYPLYLFLLLVASLFLFTTGFGHPFLTPRNIFANLTIIPLNYFMFADFTTVVADKHSCIINTGWSLGAEMQAYLILPLIIRFLPLKWIAGLLSLGVFSFAMAGFIDANTWGYRLVPGVLLFFLTGSAIAKTLKHEKAADAFDKSFPFVCWTWLLCLLLALALTNHLGDNAVEVMLGFIVGMPVLWFTSRAPLRIPFDGILGRLSYGLFLIHVPAIWLYQYLFRDHTITGRAALLGHSTFLFVMVVSLILAGIATFTVERMVWPLRNKLTQQPRKA